ncbi:ABC transporter ATP-binding protein [Halorhodospira halophila]|uniref:ABC transporter related protein n=1 Tax=Halorhodospira halophila (strain DSM 244 / SL1) TaxID=349124 RepID=A1WU11_HALHL|nr:ATP-binding cassette domain-containing protein [Halorhodospira halophila]ABM61173.1 ABC transporter related protein [Halorhodospira halophila SL1]MBK1729634.1 ABC transporter [Halorhodospira halophila]
MITLDDITYIYPFQSQAALTGVRLHVARGEAIAVTGASGCGKSSLVRVINGLIPHHYQGEWDGQARIAGYSPREASLAEISSRVGTLFQDPEQQFFALHVEDELAFAHEQRGEDPAVIEARVRWAMGRFQLTGLADASVYDLSDGQKQRVGLAEVMSRAPSVLVLDEPTANLDPEATRELADHLAELREEGVTLVIVDHRLYWLTDLVDRILVMEGGCLAMSGSASEVARERLRFGLRRLEVVDQRGALPEVPASGEGHLRVSGLAFAYRNGPTVIKGMDLCLPSGEIVGVLGPNGAGKTTLARLLTGLLRPDAGEIRVRGRVLSGCALMHRTSVVLQNTDHQLHMRTVEEEITSAAQGARVQTDPAWIAGLLHEYGLTALRHRHPQSLSGGEKQRLVVACGHARKPELFVLDEPTSGLDGANLAIIVQNLQRIADSGTCVMVITHDLELIECACTRQLTLPGC